jgi:hypothetical protein
MEFLYPHISDHEMRNIDFLHEGGVIVLPSVFHSLKANVAVCFSPFS